MAALARLFIMQNKNLVMALLVLTMIVLLLFLPEIFGLKKTATRFTLGTTIQQLVGKIGNSFSGSDTRERPLLSEEYTSDEGLYKSPLEEILANFDILSGRNSSSQNVQKPLMDFSPGSETVISLGNSADLASNIAGRLGGEYRESRYALVDYAAGVRYVLGDGQNLFEPEQIFEYLSGLARGVDLAFGTENVPGNYQEMWDETRDVLPFQSTDALKGSIVSGKKRRAQLILGEIFVQQPPKSDFSRNPADPAYARIDFYVRGDDIKKVALLRNGRYVKDLPVQVEVDEYGFRLMHIYQMDARGKYTFRVYDGSGPILEKKYEFYSKANNFAWDAKDFGRFKIPFGDGRVDRRMDRYFLVGGSGAGSSEGKEQVPLFSGSRAISRF